VNQLLATSLGFRNPSLTPIACKESEDRIVPFHSLCKITTDERTLHGIRYEVGKWRREGRGRQKVEKSLWVSVNESS